MPIVPNDQLTWPKALLSRCVVWFFQVSLALWHLQDIRPVTRSNRARKYNKLPRVTLVQRPGSIQHHGNDRMQARLEKLTPARVRQRRRIRVSESTRAQTETATATTNHGEKWCTHTHTQTMKSRRYYAGGRIHALNFWRVRPGHVQMCAR